jgi:hypothetical protein
MIKDTAQKQMAIRYCVATGIIPYLEVVVRYIAEVAAVEANISDVDVLGIRPAALTPQQKFIFDCKTQNKVSAVGRALWTAGLMKLIGADGAYVILNKAAHEGHRLAANELGVRLTSELLFDNFGKLASPSYAEGATYLDIVESWQSIFGLPKGNENLAPLVEFVLQVGPLERDAVAGFRSLLARLRRAEGEFDVAKPAHRTLWGLVVCEALRLLSSMAVEFNNVFDPAMDKDQFGSLLRNYVWGGRESYQLRQKLHAQVRNARHGEEASQLDLPGWDRFVELMRSFMDAPHLASSGVLAAKDVAFRELSASPRELADRRIKTELNSTTRARQFVMATSKYLGSLSVHLKESGNRFAEAMAGA